MDGGALVFGGIHHLSDELRSEPKHEHATKACAPDRLVARKFPADVIMPLINRSS